MKGFRQRYACLERFNYDFDQKPMQKKRKSTLKLKKDKFIKHWLSEPVI
jgi:hypothetical protein